MSSNIPKVSLSFSKIIGKKKLHTSALGNVISEVNEESKQSILLFDKNTKPSEPYKPEDSLVIPLVESKRDSLYKKIKEKQISSTTENEKSKEEEAEMTIDDQAAAAVIEESARKMEELQSKSSNDSSFRLNMLIPSISELLDTEGDVSTLDDYDQINVQHFGAALLRGMGWSKDQGVGKNKKVIEIIDPTNKGLTLTKKEGKVKNAEEPEEEEMKKGCHVLIEGGRNRGTYGVIESVDEDHILIRMAREDKVLRDVEQNVRVVSAKEYKDFSRVINKDMYDEYKAAESNKRKEKQKDYDKPTKDKKIKKEEIDLKREEILSKQDKTTYRDKPALQSLKNNETHDTDIQKFERNRNESQKQNEESKRNYDEYDRMKCSKKDKEDRYYKEDKEKGRHYENKEKDRYYKDDKDKDRHYKEDKDRYYKDDKDKDRHYENKEDRYKDDKDKNRHYKEDKDKDKYYKEDKEKGSKGSLLDKDKRKDYSMNLAKNPSLPLPIPWARENLRVRIIDKQYKGGKFHKEKVIVSSIDTVESCTCISEEGKTLYNINPNNLETVIPKSSSGTVLIVKGNYKGQKARILELHKEKESATIQLLDERSVILKLYYDDICEYASR